jgi:glycopeptide antibiotics resistance protein
MLTLDQGIIMGLTLNTIGLTIIFIIFYFIRKNLIKKAQEEEDAKKPKPWVG